MTTTDALAGLAIALGVVGIVVPILPGTALILVALLLWAVAVATTTAWAVFAVGSTLLVLGAVAKYAIPGKRLKAVGVPNSTMVAGGLLGIAGFFVIPIVGVFVGFVLGVYLAELRRVGSADAWRSTWAAMKAAGLSLLIELAAGLLAATAFTIGVVAG